MSALSFTVPGEPRGKGRARATTINGHARLFTDAKTAAYENLVRLAAAAALAGAPPLEGPLSLSVVARLTPAASASRRQRLAMLAGEVAPTKRPDLDNIIKAVLDGLNAVAFRDDAQITTILARKTYDHTAGVDVSIGLARAP